MVGSGDWKLPRLDLVLDGDLNIVFFFPAMLNKTVKQSDPPVNQDAKQILYKRKKT